MASSVAGPSSAGRRTSSGTSALNPVLGMPLVNHIYTLQDFESIAGRLSDPSLDTSTKLKIANEMKEIVETVSTNIDPVKMFDLLVPCVMDLLKKDKPSFVAGPDNSMRSVLLNILHRLPHLEPLRGHAVSVVKDLLVLLKTENEENAIVCLKVIMDFHRSFSRPPVTAQNPATKPEGADASNSPMAETAQELLDIIAELFTEMPQVVANTFGNSNPPPIDQITPAMESFKLLQECPASIVLILQTYRHITGQAITTFVPLVFRFLQSQAVPQAQQHASMPPGVYWVGMAPGIPQTKRQSFTDMVMAQMKTMSFLAYILRVNTAALKDFFNVLPDIAIRLLQDTPSECVSMRRDLLIATRHILQSDLKTEFISKIDVLLDPYVLVGCGVTGYEHLRPLGSSMLADLVHHIRMELSLEQLARVVHVYSLHIHDFTLSASIQIMCSKLLLNLVEPIASSNKDPVEACKILHRSMEAVVSKMESIADTRNEWQKWVKPRKSLAVLMETLSDQIDKEEEGAKEITETIKDEDAMEVDKPEQEPEAPIEFDEIDVERSKAVGKVAIVIEPGPDPVKDSRFLFRNLLFGFKTMTLAVNRLQGPPVSPELLRRFFHACVKSMSIFSTEGSTRDQGREQKEVMEVFASVLVSAELIVFQEVMEHEMPFFLSELILNHELLVIPQSLLSNDIVSQIFVGILFRFLISHLEELGHKPKEYTAIMLRLYKMSFMAVTIFPEKNEPVLLPHLSSLIMSSLQLASKVPEPSSYYLLLRALFRSIGGGRFEILYKEVLPLLPTLLDKLNSLLKDAEKTKRDLFAELILTVPVRLSVLLPYLSYLMRPLVHALQGPPDLVSQGLRTLELCVDNLTPEFLNPLMAPVIDELMVALWALLRPVPFNHQHAHTTMRILGKIGGRNRRGFNIPPLDWKSVGPEALLKIQFEGKDAGLKIDLVVEVALKIVEKNEVHFKQAAVSFLKHASAFFLKNDLQAGEPEKTFKKVLVGLFSATHILEFREEIEDFIIQMSTQCVDAELEKPALPENPRTGASINAHHVPLHPLCSALFDAMIESLCIADHTQRDGATELTRRILVELLSSRDPQLIKRILEVREQEKDRNLPLDHHGVLLHNFCLRLASVCYEPSWQRKVGATMGLDIMISKINIETQWVLDHSIDLMRALIFALKDMPGDAPLYSDFVEEVLLKVVRMVGASLDKEELTNAKTQTHYRLGVLVVELHSQVAAVREAVKKGLDIFSEALGVTKKDMLMPVRERITNPIFTKPLRALGFAMQIGNIDAVTYCLKLDPPLVPFDDQLIRLLTEAVGIAEADDAALTGSKASSKPSAPLTQLRVVCIQLLAAAILSPDFSSQSNMKLKALSVFFKLLYFKSPEVVDAAYQSLTQVMAVQGKLPRDLLQTGLKPVLMNLSNHKNLSVSSLQGLARLLELLTNYFKVEIGNKLVDHFKQIALPETITKAATDVSVVEDNPLDVLAAIINVFHLLPHPAAAVFLNDLVQAVVGVERQLKKLKTSIFTKPLALYLNFYPQETVNYIFEHIGEERYIPTFRAILSSEHVPAVKALLLENTDVFHASFDADGEVGYFAAQLVEEIFDDNPEYMDARRKIISILCARWTSENRARRLASTGDLYYQQIREDALVISIFIKYLGQEEDINLLFSLVDPFTRKTPSNLMALYNFMIRTIALGSASNVKQKIVSRYFELFEDPQLSTVAKTFMLRLLVNPILLSAFSARDTSIITPAILNKIHLKLWKPYGAKSQEAVEQEPPNFLEDSLKIEYFQMSTLIIRSYPHSVAAFKRDAIKFGWGHSKMVDLIAAQSAYMLVSVFLRRYDAPPKIIVQVYIGLLKSHHIETRQLVRESLDLLTPRLVRVPVAVEPDNSKSVQGPQTVQHPSAPSNQQGQANQVGQQTGIGWLKAMRMVLTDEGGTPQHINVYQVLFRHTDLFYPHRGTFVLPLLHTVGKIASNTTIESKTLTLDIVEVILKWERRRVELGEEPLADTDPRAVPQANRDQIVNILLRFFTASPETANRGPLMVRTLAILKELITPPLWSECNVKINFFQRIFAQNEITEENTVQLCNAVEVLNVVTLLKSQEWWISNLSLIHPVVEKGLKSGESRLIYAMRTLLEHLFEHVTKELMSMGEEESAEAKSFIEWATDMINEGLKPTSTSIQAPISLLQAWSKFAPENIDQFVPSLIRVFSRLSKDHITAAAPVSSSDPQLRLLISGLDILRSRIGHLGEQRRWFLSAIVQLVEKSSNLDVCRYLLGMTRRWVLDKQETFPTQKEKAGVLLKMTSFEARNNEPLLKEYLGIILEVYTDPALARSELTMKLEPAFLMGCKSRDLALRSKFLSVFDKSLVPNLFTRLHFLLGVQSWENLAETYWIQQAVDLYLGAVNPEPLLFSPSNLPASSEKNIAFFQQIKAYTTGDIIADIRKLVHSDPAVAHSTWISAFQAGWSCLNRRDQLEVTRFLVTLLAKEYHLRSVDRRPNVIQSLLSGVVACNPAPVLPPHLVRYLAQTFNAWHVGLELLSESLLNPREEDSPSSVVQDAVIRDGPFRDLTQDALAGLYAQLNEDDLLYGLWRRRAAYNETNCAISWEQAGEWVNAQCLYESAQITARNGLLPFTEAELAVWEDHWIVTSEKLQQWDMLSELATTEGNKELLMECLWRTSDWSQNRETVEATIEGMNPAATPRKRVYEALVCLLKQHGKAGGGSAEDKKAFTKIVDEGIQLSLRKWYHLPEIVGQAQYPLLSIFQQFVELQEANQIFATLQTTNTGNLDTRSQELKQILAIWRDRLPNLWDDINIWSDLVAWRQHVFSTVNLTYLPLAPTGAAPGGAQSSAYRGYHEMAWIINRFAHVARKHHLSDVCTSSLTRIYTLPNIEIQEAFLKLREQAKCHYQTPSQLNNGLEVINNTNLMYFNNAQKAEFFTLKAMYFAKLNLDDDANQTFSLAVSMDMTFAKAWSEWGEYQDRMFKANGQDLSIANHALTCYLQAAGLYKDSRVRKLLVRIMWLLSLDDTNGTICKAFDNFKGETPTWYWITLIPQLLLSLGAREYRHTNAILLKISKQYPQALFFPLRTMREEFSQQRRQTQQARQQQAAAAATAASANSNSETTNGESEHAPQIPPSAHPQWNLGMKYPWEHGDEIMSNLKTSFPLLALSMEMIVDQIATRFKPTPDEDVYRLVTALLADSLQQYFARASQQNDDGLVQAATTQNIVRFSENLTPPKTKERFEKDFLGSKPTMRQYVDRLQCWRDEYEALLKTKIKSVNLEGTSHWLVEFQYQKFDEIEVPGQYLKMEDNNSNFVRIANFSNRFDLGRSHGLFFRRLYINGTDGTVHLFAIQVPSVRTARREERMYQLFRMINSPLLTKVEARKRNVSFTIPTVVPLAPAVRLIENDPSTISLQDILEDHCTAIGIKKEEPILLVAERIRSLHKAHPTLGRQELWNGRLEVTQEIASKLIPDDVLHNYLSRSMSTATDLWYLRKNMTIQFASFIVGTYSLSIGSRVPSRIFMSRTTGKVYTSDIIPGVNPIKTEFCNTEPVPFRFTPNMQRFVTPIGIEGLLSSSILAIARALVETPYDMEHRMSIYVREELSAWASVAKSADIKQNLTPITIANLEQIVKKTALMSCKIEREKPPPPSPTVPVNQSIVELLMTATNMQFLSRCDPSMYPTL